MNSEPVSPAAASSDNYTYFAFISYKSADEKWARWLKRHLHNYRLPARTHRKNPQVQKRCSPIFLDKTNLTPGLLDSGLSSEVQSARYLIVICSRKAAENSRYLDDELRYFLEGSGDLGRVIPFIVDKSDHPVEECFPAYLAQLSREKDIAGVSIYDDGPRTALLRLIAAMLGIRREELESDDLRRRRKNRLAAALLALVVMAGAWKAWDYYTPKTKYYADYTEVYGVPKGIGELKENELPSMNAHYTLLSSRGRVRELRYENSAGKLMPDTHPTRIDRFSRAEYVYADDGGLSSVNQYNENGQLATELHYISRNTVDLSRHPETESGGFSMAAPLPSHITVDPLEDDSGEKDRKSSVIRYLVTYDASGFPLEVHYASDAYNHSAHDADGISGIRFERDGQGRIIRLLYLTYVASGSTDATRAENYRVVGKRSGLAGIEFLYDDAGDCVGQRMLDAQGELITLASSGAVTASEYENHNEVRTSYYDTQGSPFLTELGFAAQENRYDARGNQVRVGFLGTDGEPVFHRDGISGWESQVDENGREIRRSFFDPDGNPVLHDICVAGYESVFDESGNEIRCSYFGTDGEPVLSEDGIAGWETLFDDRGHPVRVGYFGTDGQPVLMKDAYAGWTYAYDERGNVIRCSYFGADGEAILSRDDIAGWDAVYDERGNEVRVAFFGTDGQPALCQYGYAGWDAAYDERGNQIRLGFFGKDGQPVLNTDGVAGWEYAYDERGNETECRCF